MKNLTKGLITSAVAIAISGAPIAVMAKKKGNCDGEEATLLQNAQLGIEEAIAIALKDKPGKVIEAEIDSEDGVTIWEVELVDSQNHIYEYEIDANSGTILESERDDD